MMAAIPLLIVPWPLYCPVPTTGRHGEKLCNSEKCKGCGYCARRQQ